MKEKSLTDAKLQEIKNEVKTIIKKTKKKVVVTEQRESESEDEEIFIELDSEGEAVLLKECKEPVESFLCDTQKKNDIHNEDQNNINKNDKFIAKKLLKTLKLNSNKSKMKVDVLNELFNVRHTEIKEEETQHKLIRRVKE